MAYPQYPGMPAPGPPHGMPGMHQPPPAGGPGQQRHDFVQVKIRYRDRDMAGTYKVHVFAEDKVLGNIRGEVQGLHPRAELKHNNEAHCITLSKMGKVCHHFDIQLFRVLNRRGFKLKTSHSTTIPDGGANDILTTYILARGGAQ